MKPSSFLNTFRSSSPGVVPRHKARMPSNSSLLRYNTRSTASNARSRVLLIQSECQAAPSWTDQVHLHDHRHGPAERLIDPKRDVGNVEPIPVICEDDDERNRKADEPNCDKNLLPPNPFRGARSKQVADGLSLAKAYDEGHDGRLRYEAKLLLAYQRHDVRSSATVMPTKTLIKTSSENCPTFSRRPSLIEPTSS